MGTIFTRRTCLKVAAVTAAGTLVPAGVLDAPAEASETFLSSGPGIDYGSGHLGDWSQRSHSLTNNWGTADVAIVGDSITGLGWPTLQASLSQSGKTLAVDSWNGRPTAPAVDALLARPVLPKILVMATGTNDIFDPTAMGAQISRVVDNVQDLGVDHLFWVDVQACRTHVRGPMQIADQRNAGWVNNQIHSGVHANQVIPWQQWLISKPGRLATYLSDGIHPKPGKGTVFWSWVIMNNLSPLLGGSS